MLPFHAMYLFQVGAMGAEQHFGRLAAASSGGAALLLALTLGFVPWIGLVGAVFAAWLHRVLVTGFMLRGVDWRPRPVLCIGPFIEVARAGFVYWTTVLLVLVYSSADRLLVAALLSREELGLYGLALAASGRLRQWVGALDASLQPRMMALARLQANGEQTLIKPVRVRVPHALMFTMVAGAAAFLGPPAIELLFPAFAGVRAPLQILCVGAVVALPAVGAGSRLLALDRQRTLRRSYLGAGATNLMISYGLIQAGFGPAGTAMGVVAAEFARATLQMSASWRTVHNTLRGSSRLAVHAVLEVLPVIAGSGTAWALVSRRPDSSSLAPALLVYGAVFLAVALLATRLRRGLEGDRHLCDYLHAVRA